MKFGILAAVAAVVATTCIQVGAQDIFIGTLTMEGQELVLKRCDLVQNLYVLEDAKTQSKKLVKKYVKKPEHKKGVWYAEVVGVYGERDGKNTLEVLSLDNVTAGKNCHLSDEIEPPAKK